MGTEAPTTDVADEAPAEPAEVVQPDEQPGGPVEIVREPTASEDAANRAIVAASEAAIANPGIPGRDEFLSLAMQARILSMSGAAPAPVQDNPHLAFHIAMVGRDLGISPSAALELIDVIPGRGNKPPQLSLSPQLINGQIRRLGLGSIVPVIKSNTRCVAVAMGPDGFYDPRCKPRWPDHHELCTCRIESFLGESEFSWEDAQMAGLVRGDCQPGNHSTGCKGEGSRSCNTGYQNYPKRMMWWRASGFLADDIFPEASLGMYTPEALGAVVDADGRPIDPSDVELPSGYEPKALPPPPPPKETAPPAAADVLEDLRIRVAALPDEQRATYAEKWKESQRLRGFRLDNLPEDRLNLATSMLKGFESIAARAGWDAAAARAEVEARTPPAAQEAADDAESPGEPDAAEESPGEPTDAQSGQDDDPDRDRPAPDPEIAAWVREISGAAPADLTASTVAEVKALHHATVNRELTERGWDPEGQHIDTRRMVLTAARIAEVLQPDQCMMIRCEDARAELESGGLPSPYCTGHTAF